MKTFEIGYKQFFNQESDYVSVFIRAKSKENALRRFAKDHKIKTDTLAHPETWKWWDNETAFSDFRFIKEVDARPCPQCNGTGRVAVGET